MPPQAAALDARSRSSPPNLQRHPNKSAGARQPVTHARCSQPAIRVDGRFRRALEEGRLLWHQAWFAVGAGSVERYHPLGQGIFRCIRQLSCSSNASLMNTPNGARSRKRNDRRHRRGGGVRHSMSGSSRQHCRPHPAGGLDCLMLRRTRTPQTCCCALSPAKPRCPGRMTSRER